MSTVMCMSSIVFVYTNCIVPVGCVLYMFSCYNKIIKKKMSTPYHDTVKHSLLYNFKSKLGFYILFNSQDHIGGARSPALPLTGVRPTHRWQPVIRWLYCTVLISITQKLVVYLKDIETMVQWKYFKLTNITEKNLFLSLSF